MSPNDLVIPPPSPRLINYPGVIGIGIGIIFAAMLLYISSKFDPTAGVLTISLLVVISFFGVIAVCLFYTIPQDETTSMVIGGLVAAFGAVIAHWLGRHKNGPQ